MAFAWHYDLPPIEDANGDNVVVKMVPKHSEDRTNVIYIKDRQIRIADLSQLKARQYRFVLTLDDGKDEVNFDLLFDVKEAKKSFQANLNQSEDSQVDHLSDLSAQ